MLNKKRNCLMDEYLHLLLPSKLRSSDWLVTVISGYL